MKTSSINYPVVLSLLLLGGCAGTPTMQEVPGSLYADYKMAQDAEGPVGVKTGKACATSILGWFSSGDASIEAAAANGGITSVTSIDRTSKNILGIHATYCTVVHGA